MNFSLRKLNSMMYRCHKWKRIIIQLLHYWKAEFLCRLKTDRNTDRKYKTNFLTVIREKNTDRPSLIGK